MTKRTKIGNYLSRSMPRKRTVAVSSENGNRPIFSGKKHCHGNSGTVENRMAMTLLLTTDEEAKFSTLLLVRRSIGKSKRVGQRYIGRPEELRSENQIHKETQAHLDAIIAFGRWKAGQCMDHVHEYLLRTINIVIRHDETGIARARLEQRSV